jgi:hypothetical protein
LSQKQLYDKYRKNNNNIIHPKKSRNSLKLQVTFDDTDIVCKAELKFLDMHVTEIPKQYVQLRSLCPKLSNVCKITKSLKEVMSPHLTRTVYYASFYTLLIYGVFWCGDNDNNSYLN